MIGETIGAYRVTAKLGQGGMGIVFVAEHTLLGKRAAVKVLLPEYSRDAAVIERFFNEARATTRVRHPGLVDIYDFGYHSDGSAFIVMELLDGESLATRLQRMRRLPESDLVDIARQVASALGAAHDVGIVHRDLKPDNVFLVPDAMVPGGQRVKVLDFGIAKLIGEQSIQKTRTGAILGTPTYMSPEQCRGQTGVDARSDIYALGCMMFEMAAGRPPYVGIGTGDVLAAHIYEAIPPLDEAEASPPIGALVAHMMAKRADERPQSMREVLAALDGGARPARERSWPGADRHGLATVAGAANAPAPRTTLGRSAGELVTTSPPSRGRASLLPVVLAVVGLAVGGGTMWAWHVKTVHRIADEQAAAERVRAERAAAAAAVAPRPGAPATVRLRIESEPAGADVYRQEQGSERIGVTPLVDERARGEGEVGYVLRLRGYSEQTISIGRARDATRTVALRRQRHHAVRAGVPDDRKDAIVDPFGEPTATGRSRR